MIYGSLKAYGGALLFFLCVAVIAGCGGGGGGGNGTPAPSGGGGGADRTNNVVAVSVNGSLCLQNGSYFNEPCVSVTVCTP
ncbi:MAG: hypothetical protein M0Z75_11565, partial [Nitrospiraceae bacterium]|nr:hypothetical protein [Nitrospiraceae bacterium]